MPVTRKKETTEKRRTEIIRAALACFTELGYDRTTMSEIRHRSRASTGSIYHHFSSKERLAAAVYLEGILDWQRGFAAELDRHRSARSGITAIARYHLHWVEDHPDWARFLFQMRHAEFMAAAEDRITRANDHFQGRVARWFQPHVASGKLRRLPAELFISILMGPSQDFAKIWVTGQTGLDLDRSAKALGEAAWRALRAEGGGG